MPNLRIYRVNHWITTRYIAQFFKIEYNIISWEHTVGLRVLRDAALDVGATRRAHVDTKGRGAAG